MIESVLQETRIFPAPAAFSDKAQIPTMQAYQKLCQQAEEDYLGFWAERARALISWRQPFTQIHDSSRAPFFTWFADGCLNVSYNCLDRHLPDKADKTAIIFEADDGAVCSVTYRELYVQVCQCANGLKERGIQKGDRVVIYMPMGIEAVVAMQACARIGAIHSVVFAGFSAKSLQERILDAAAVAVITANEAVRGGKNIPLKALVDEALAMDGYTGVSSVLVLRRTANIPDQWSARDIWWDELLARQPAECPPEWVMAEHPLFILYTSGSTGKPKGIQHSSAGYLLGALNSFGWVFDARAQDIFWCTADVGWITGHSYVCYGPLAYGATQVIFEGVPTYPNAERFWAMIERHKVSIFYTAPTAIRSLIKLDSMAPTRYDLSSLRLLGSVGEPINPEAWMWYYQTVGRGGCPIVDTWWQTETGSVMIAPLPGAIPTKPGSCTLPLPGVLADIVDEEGMSVIDGAGGMLVLKKPVPSLARTIWNDAARFQKTYFPENFQGTYYLAGDSAHRDEQGYFWIMGRIDDVLNVSGHRLGTMEIESALVANTLVAEAAIVGRPHPIKGEAVVAFVVLKDIRPTGQAAEQVAQTLKAWVASQIGKLAQPDEIRFGDNLPKTRSGKIMRRLLRAIARGEPITQDISTLENPAIVTQLQSTL